MCDDTNQKKSNFLPGLVSGLVVGAGIAYYLTQTEEGKKLKKKLITKGEAALEGAREIVADLEEKGEELRGRAKELQAQLEEKVQEAKTEVKQEAEEKVEEVEKLRERGRTAVKKFFHKGGKSLVK